MRQYQVPQFITVEDKVIGPFTIKQFFYLGAGAVLIFIASRFFTGFLFYLTALIIGSLAGSLAFLKLNEQPFPIILKSAALYLIRPRLYLWKKEPPSKKAKPEERLKKPEVLIKNIPKLSESKLNDLAWSLDIKEKTQEPRRE